MVEWEGRGGGRQGVEGWSGQLGQWCIVLRKEEGRGVAVFTRR